MILSKEQQDFLNNAPALVQSILQTTDDQLRIAGFPLNLVEWEQHTKTMYIQALASIHTYDNTHLHITRILQNTSQQVRGSLQQQVNAMYPYIFQALRASLEQYGSFRRTALLPEEAYDVAVIDWLALDVFPILDWPEHILTTYADLSSADLMPLITQLIAEKKQEFSLRQDAFMRWWRLFLLSWMRRDIKYLSTLQK